MVTLLSPLLVPKAQSKFTVNGSAVNGTTVRVEGGFEDHHCAVEKVKRGRMQLGNEGIDEREAPMGFDLQGSTYIQRSTYIVIVHQSMVPRQSQYSHGWRLLESHSTFVGIYAVSQASCSRRRHPSNLEILHNPVNPQPALVVQQVLGMGDELVACPSLASTSDRPASSATHRRRKGKDGHRLKRQCPQQ